MSDYRPKNYGNPLRAINGRPIRCPSSLQFGIQDVSASDSGRTEDGKMDKMKIGQCVKLECEWRNISIAECAAILQACKGEYMDVTFLDLRTGGYTTSEFYIGDRKAPIYNTRLGIVSSLGFNFIEREAR